MTATAASIQALDARIADLQSRGLDTSVLVQQRATQARELAANGGTVPSSDPNSVGIVTPHTANDATGSRAGRDVANSLSSTVSNGIQTIRDGVTSLVNGATGSGNNANANDDDDDTPGTGTNRNRNGRFRWGDLVGGLLGVGGAYLASSIFGGGWLGTIMFALFAIPAFMMGRNGLGGTIGGWLGETPRSPQNQQGNAPSQNQSVGAGQANGVTAGQNNAPAVAEQINERKQELVLRAQAYGNLSQRAIDNRGANRRLTDTNIAELQQQNQQIARMVQAAQNTTDPVQADRILDAADQYFNTMFRQPRNAQLRNDLEVEMATLRAGVASTPTNPLVVPQVAFAGAPTNTIGAAIDPAAQAQIAAMRQNNPNYQYQQAAIDSLNAQQFNASSAQPSFTVPDYFVVR